MSLWGYFTGSDQKKQAQQTKQANDATANSASDANIAYLGTGYGNAVARYQPYAQQGQAASSAYGNMLGLNGTGAQQNAVSAYQAANPYWAANSQMQQQAIDRRSSATGQFGSGLNALARARVVNESANQNYQDYMNRLQGLGNQGYGAAGAMAGLDWGNANALVGNRNALAGNLMGNQTAYGNQMTQANGALWNNLMGVAGLGISGARLFMGQPSGGGGAQVPIGQSGYDIGNNFFGRLFN